jgi:hypothetical protein
MNPSYQTTVKTAVMEYQSNYLGQMEKIIYPDGEIVTYGYDRAGQVKTVTGVKPSVTFAYVNDIAYDEYGQRKFIEYGNGVRTNYVYDEYRRWLTSIDTKKGSTVHQSISYRFDSVGNIEGYDNKGTKYDTKPIRRPIPADTGASTVIRMESAEPLPIRQTTTKTLSLTPSGI